MCKGDEGDTEWSVRNVEWSLRVEEEDEDEVEAA